MKNKLNIIILCLVFLVMSSTFLVAQDVDFEGKTVNIIFWNPMEKALNTYGGIEKAQEAELEFNVNLEEVKIDHKKYPEELMTRVLSGDSTNDIWIIGPTQHFWQLATEDIFYPVSDILSEDYFENLPPMAKAMADYCTYKGNTYAFGSIAGVGAGIRLWGYNKELFDKEGLTDPFELYEEGEWTYEKVTELAKQLTKDTTGDGNIDQWGIGNSFGSPAWTLDFLHSNGVQIVEEKEGKMEFVFNSQNSIEALKQVDEWFNVDRVIHGGSSTEARYEGFPGTDEFMAGKVAMLEQPLFRWFKIKNGIGDTEWELIAPPKGPSVEDYTFKSSSPIAVLPVNIENPEKYIELVEFLFPREQYEDTVETYVRRHAPTQRSAKLMFELWDKSSNYNNYQGGGVVGGLVTDAIEEVIDGELEVEAALDSIEPAAKEQIDDVFNN